MIILLGYLASLFSTFVISAAVLSVILAVTTTNKAPFRNYGGRYWNVGRLIWVLMGPLPHADSYGFEGYELDAVSGKAGCPADDANRECSPRPFRSDEADS